MKPTAVACHNGSHGRRRPSASRKMTRQRIVRSGNVRVARATAPRKGQRAARRMWPSTAPGSTSRSVQYKSAIVTMNPATQAQPARSLGVGLEGEGNEIADFFDEAAERIARRLLCRFAQLPSALQRALTPVQEGPDIHDRRLHGCGSAGEGGGGGGGGGGGDRGACTGGPAGVARRGRTPG